VIDGPAVLVKLREQLSAQGVDFHFGAEAQRIDGTNTLITRQDSFSFGYLFNCAGAYADVVARYFGCAKDYKLTPFKGIYWKLSSQTSHLIRSNIYPVPDIALPFLGTHLTRVISGDVYIGPTAIPALGRENYGLLQGARLGEALGIGLELACMYVQNQNNFRLLAHTEIAKYRKDTFLKTAQKLCPAVRAEDMVRTNKAGIRPQLINRKTGKLEMDYIFERTDHSLHVLNAISPAFTSSLAFAEMIVDRAQLKL
jgi:L-2-hydroxyglutarate oxidase LhgO